MQTTYSSTIKRSLMSPFLEIWECAVTHNKSIHTTLDLEPGQVITNFRLKEVLTEPDYLTIQVGEDQHSMVDPLFLHFTNHSCNPNVVCDIQNLQFIAIKPIAKEEELTWFYPSTEWNMNQPFNCICQSGNCLGYIQGSAHLSTSILTQYQLSDFIKTKLAI
jgi:hypothetical protein